MVLLERKFGNFIRFPLGRNNRSSNQISSTATLHNFRSKILDFIWKHGGGERDGEGPSLRGLKKYFGLINFTQKALSEMVVEIDYPMRRWGSLTAEMYFNYSLNLLDLLNLITAAVLRLRHSRISVSHTLELISSYPDGELKKILDKKSESAMEINQNNSDPEKESVLLQALIVFKEISVLSLGLVLSCICSNKKIYMEARESISRSEDSVIKALDLRLREDSGIIEEIKEVNAAIEEINNGGEGAQNLKMKLQLMEKGIEGIEKEVDFLFSEVLGARNKLLDCYREELSKKLNY